MPRDADTEKAGSLWSRACAVAERTPESRNRYVDFLRAASIGAVVLGHWLILAPYVVDGRLQFDDMRHVAPWTVWLTWGFQVMPVFFMVGGYANAASWESARDKGRGYGAWIAARLQRLVGPIVPLVLVWAGLAAAARHFGIGVEVVAAGSRAALIPTWFLSVYIMVVVAVPLTHRAWDRAGAASFWILALSAVAVDVAGLAGGLPWLRWVNYAFVWLAVHQLGYLWRAGRLGGPSFTLACSAGGLAVLILLVTAAGYPVSMVSVPGEAISNSRPPTVAMIALAAMQGGLLLSFEAPARRWLRRTRPWAATILVNRSIMTLYLWHMTVIVLVVGLLDLLDGAGLTRQPGTGLWWLTRPLWIMALGIALMIPAVLFSPFEQMTRKRQGRLLPWWQAVAGAAMVCLGLAQLALHGIAADGPLGTNLLVVSLVFAGAWLVGPSSRLSRPWR